MDNWLNKQIIPFNYYSVNPPPSKNDLKICVIHASAFQVHFSQFKPVPCFIQPLHLPIYP